ncbi:STAS domain-containing protein [Maritalea mediterranea]|uniref:STAS domain-containing protein n=1 Tax=Maritalea mediterranea TaxID=2909667 RepID=A0ABS9E5L7_9HYPH|nr:STAS domain-containing protein [Maritalea mediterranea]MCF4097554.1 STAS domain-containing protein [Maritalea mediterranea]
MADAQLKTIEMPAVADTGVVDNMRDEMLDALNAGSLEIELSNVERVSTSALFMLLSAGEAARQHNYELRLSAPSEHFSSAVSTLGLEDAFDPFMKG